MNHLADNGTRAGLGGKPRPEAGPDELHELDMLRSENAQLRSLCVELEQALQEATSSQQAGGEFGEDRAREYEVLLEEKSEMIRELHQQLQEAQGIVAELEGQLASAPAARAPSGPAPREEELLALSEELERERRQLQEDEQSLMEQMREMEVSMARERAEMARQRNDLLRVQAEVRHELERLERNGALQNKIDSLKTKLQDANTRRGLSPGQSSGSINLPPPPQTPQAPPPPGRSGGNVLGRLFGGGGGK
jgi:DNA repair exonuclease SbcCD ATPase subunit